MEDLNLFAEMAALRRLAPTCRPGRFCERDRRRRAALGFGGELGSIAPGKRAELIAVRRPGRRPRDVEEYLVRGIQPMDITWLAQAEPISWHPEP